MDVLSPGSDRRRPSALQAGSHGQSAAGVLQGNPQSLDSQSSKNKLTLIAETNQTPLPQSQTEEGIRKELLALQEDKYNYETTAKESLKRVLEEKIEVVRKLSEVEVRACGELWCTSGGLCSLVALSISFSPFFSVSAL